MLLLEHPAWPSLRKWAEEEKDKHTSLLAKALIAGRDPIRSPEYLRGYFDALDHVLQQPGQADKRLDRLNNEELIS